MRSIFLILILSAFQFGYSQPGNLKITINNIKSVSGTINIGLYNNAGDFPEEEKEYKLIILEVKALEITHTFKDLPQGEYAIALYHDENKDDECNRNFFGIPKEGYGFSNNIKPTFSAPSFEDTKFQLEDSKSITISLINWIVRSRSSNILHFQLSKSCYYLPIKLMVKPSI